MYWTFNNNTDTKMVKYQIDDDSLQHTQDTFKAFVDLIVPRTPRLAEIYGDIMYYGALDLLTDEFMILSLNNYYIPLAKSTAEMLDVVAERLVFIEGEEIIIDYAKYPKGGTFAALSPNNQFHALSILYELEFYFADLPITFWEHPEFILSIANALNKITMMGYYSEWYGYGSTRLLTPNQRKFEFSPLSWTQVGYPGPSFSYMAQVMEYYERRSAYES